MAPSRSHTSRISVLITGLEALPQAGSVRTDSGPVQLDHTIGVVRVVAVSTNTLPSGVRVITPRGGVILTQPVPGSDRTALHTALTAAQKIGPPGQQLMAPSSSIEWFGLDEPSKNHEAFTRDASGTHISNWFESQPVMGWGCHLETWRGRIFRVPYLAFQVLEEQDGTDIKRVMHARVYSPRSRQCRRETIFAQSLYAYVMGLNGPNQKKANFATALRDAATDPEFISGRKTVQKVFSRTLSRADRFGMEKHTDKVRTWILGNSDGFATPSGNGLDKEIEDTYGSLSSSLELGTRVSIEFHPESRIPWFEFKGRAANSYRAPASIRPTPASVAELLSLGARATMADGIGDTIGRAARPGYAH